MLAKDTGVMERIFTDEDKAELDPRQQAIFDFSVKLSQTPPEVSKADMEALKAAGLDPAGFSTWSYRPHSLDGRTGSCIRWAIRSRRKISGRSAEGFNPLLQWRMAREEGLHPPRVNRKRCHFVR